MLRQHSPRWVALLLAACAHSLICPHSGADALRLSGESRTGTVRMAMSEAPRKRKRERILNLFKKSKPSATVATAEITSTQPDLVPSTELHDAHKRIADLEGSAAATGPRTAWSARLR